MGMVQGRIKVLVADDDEKTQKLFSTTLKRSRYVYFSTHLASEITTIAREKKPHIAFIDLGLSPQNCLDILKQTKKIIPHSVIIAITDNGCLDSAIAAFKGGSSDYIQKPISEKRLNSILRNASKSIRSVAADKRSLHNLKHGDNPDCLICNHRAMKNTFAEVRQIAKTDVNVLIFGESGTGKEVISRLIHMNSLRGERPFVPVDCAALPENLLETELFGHEKGAFTGATTEKRGLFEYADKGTIFLDELCSMSRGVQAKLLRFLEDFHFRRVGGNTLRSADVRIISATNVDLQDAIAENMLREDLFYRLNVVNIYLPPLRQRKECIPELISHFIRKYSSLYDKKVRGIDKGAEKLLIDYDWPGNIRELRNIIQKAVCLNDRPMIAICDLPENIIHPTEGLRSKKKKLGPFKAEKERHIQTFERSYFERLLMQTDGNVTRAAEIAQISRKALYDMMRRIDIKPGQVFAKS